MNLQKINKEFKIELKERLREKEFFNRKML